MINYQNIFNRDHYPTPESVAEQMAGMCELAGKIVLDPSCGAGNLLNYAAKCGAERTIGCEINDDLRRAVSTRHEVIGSNFFGITSEQISHVQVILMNPPFSCQEKHIMHAWEVAPGGCEIISLCNSSAFDSYTSREFCRFVEQNGSHEEIGNAFSEDADRTTDCRISIIRMYKPKTGSEEWDDYFTNEEDEKEPQGEGIIPHNEVRELVNRVVGAVNMFDEAMASAKKINSFVEPLGVQDILFGCYSSKRNDMVSMTRDQYKKEIQKRAWRYVFSLFNMQKYVTKGVMEKINKAVEMQQNMPFTMKNVYKMVEMIVGTHGDRMQQVICEAFDTICYFSKDNVTAVEETWHTNSSHMVNRRFIVPYMAEYNSYGRTNRFVYLSWNGCRDKMQDIVKALCCLTGQDYDKLNVGYPEDMAWGEWYEWTFFRVRFYKKGTAHFEFLDEDVWYKFNQTVAERRGWALPVKTKTKKKSSNN